MEDIIGSKKVQRHNDIIRIKKAIMGTINTKGYPEKEQVILYFMDSLKMARRTVVEYVDTAIYGCGCIVEDGLIKPRDEAKYKKGLFDFKEIDITKISNG